MKNNKSRLTIQQQQKIKALEEELGIELTPNLKQENPIQGEYYQLFEDDRL